MRKAGWASGRGDCEHVLYFMLPPAATPEGSGSVQVGEPARSHGSCLTSFERSALATTFRFGAQEGFPSLRGANESLWCEWHAEMLAEPYFMGSKKK